MDFNVLARWLLTRLCKLFICLFIWRIKMRKTLIAAAIAASFAAPAFAEDAPESTLTYNVGAVSDYVFRGITQTRGEGAVQAGVDYAHASGLYVGAWGSNVKWVGDGGYYDKGDYLELDIYGGYKWAVGDVGMDVGLITYNYPGSLISGMKTPDTQEVYIGATYGIATLKYNYVVSDNFIGWYQTGPYKKSQGSGYTDLTVTYPVNETLSLIAHVGSQFVKNRTDASYSDWKVGVTKDVGFGVVGLAVTGSDAKQKAGEAYDKTLWGNEVDIAGTRVALSFLKTF
jgi:uncharacterized protein (TIGR02001 family)